MKTCQSCLIEKSETEFPVRNDRSGRLRPYCNSCRRDISKARYNYHKRTQPFKLRCTRARSRSQYLKVPFNLSPEYLKSIWSGTCPIFNIPLKLETDRINEDAAELDRFNPELGYTQGNVAFISRKANRLKNSGNLEELKAIVKWMEDNES